MRSVLRKPFVPLIAALMLVGCDAPKDATPKGAAVVDQPAVRSAALPTPVANTVQRLREIAAQGNYRELAKLADQTPDFRSNNVGLSHLAYWDLKARTGDFPTAHIEK